MYRNSYQRGLFTIFYSCGSQPLRLWDSFVKDGYISRFLDPDIRSTVLEIGGSNVSTTYIICPKGNKLLGIHMPFLVMVVKNLKKYFSFEVTILDETGTRRRFRVSNFQSTTQIFPLCTVMPIGLSDGWNQIQLNMTEFTRRAYQKQFVEVQKLKINANIRLRRVYFTDRLIPEDDLPSEYKLFFPLPTKSAKNKKKVQDINENIELSPTPPAVEEVIPKANEQIKVEPKVSKQLASLSKFADIVQGALNVAQTAMDVKVDESEKVLIAAASLEVMTQGTETGENETKVTASELFGDDEPLVEADLNAEEGYDAEIADNLKIPDNIAEADNPEPADISEAAELLPTNDIHLTDE